MTFGKRLKKLRTEKEITQSELGVVLNLSIANISKYENDLFEPSLETLIILSNYFNCSVDFLMGKSDVRNPESHNENLKEYEVIVEKAKGSNISPKLLEKLITNYLDLIDND